MPKAKTSSTAKKRFRKVGASKRLIKRSKAYRRHLLTKKTTKRKRKLRELSYVSAADQQHIERMMPYK